MAGKLLSSSIAAPGFMGLNSQDSGVTLEAGYATKAYNCIIDRYGRLGSRRGWTMVTTNNGDLADTDYIESIFEFKDVTGSITYLSSGGGKIFSGTTTLTTHPVKAADQTTDVSVTFTGNSWQWATLQEGSGSGASSYAFAVQNGNRMMVYRRSSHSGPYILQRIGDYGSSPSGVTTFDPDCITSAFGRIWVAGLTETKTTIYYSKLLDGAGFTGTGSGLIDISSVVGGNDEIVALAQHNGYLVVFCKNNIVIYNNPSDPTALQLADVITGVGCIARDTVQATGTDLYFLSKSGVRSLNRTIQENTMPMREVSLNIRDELTSYLNGEVIKNIKSAYFERDAFYLLTLPSLKQIVCFDTRTQLQNGSARTTIWSGLSHKAFCTTEDRNLLIGQKGGIAKYYGYTDNNATYRLEYFTSVSDLGEPTILKLLKKISLIVIGGSTQDFSIKYGFDYTTSYTSRAFTTNLGGTSAEYNIAEYNIGEFTSGIAINTITIQASGSGKVLQLGVEATISGVPVSVQKIDTYLVRGKLA